MNSLKLVESICALDELNDSQRLLINEAETVMHKAYSPFSRFLVGSAVRSVDGQIVTGTNVENAAFGTICAERAALVKANSLGLRKFDAIAVITRGQDFDTEEVFGPCGSCRQMIYEFSELSERDIEVLVSTTRKDKILRTSIAQLLPHAFGPKSLGLDVQKLAVSM